MTEREDRDGTEGGGAAMPVIDRTPPGGCGFTGCMWMVMIVFSLLLALLIFGLLTRVWIAPPPVR
ncbi:MAG TPA: hypothetical protein VF665_22305 [Longimicrobium sp.]|uniref:hypothetical protein n=1 Tax=Longimicrobium sp. TaxID=2029185 RepID=UPI002ED93464